MQDAAVFRLITALAAARPTYGYRRIAAFLNRRLRAQALASVNYKRVYRTMRVRTTARFARSSSVDRGIAARLLVI